MIYALKEMFRLKTWSGLVSFANLDGLASDWGRVERDTF